MFDDENNMLASTCRSSWKHSVARLIGAPGYIGYDEGGQLTEAIKRRPYSVVLLDEIEKAHPDVFNILLQLLDDGRITDSKGRTGDCKNTVLIMTSNIGARKIMDAAGDREKAKTAVMEELKRTVKPEFLDRIDDVIVFDALTRDNMNHIFDIQLKRVKRLLADRFLEIEVTENAKQALCDAGFDPAFGARPLKRAIQQYLLNPMSKAIVAGGYGPGDTVRVDVEGRRRPKSPSSEFRPQTRTAVSRGPMAPPRLSHPRQPEMDHAHARALMIHTQLRGRGIRDEAVLETLAHLPRHRFIRRKSGPARRDGPVGIQEGQTISQPMWWP